MGWGGGCLIDGKPFSFYVPHDGESMNKQQLIDKAIDELKGEWPSMGGAYLCRSDYGAYFSLSCLPPMMCKPEICTRQEFEARKAERDAASSRMADIMFGNSLPGFNEKVETESWFDYENQKALRLPPVGEVVEFMRGIHISNPLKVLAYEDGSVILWRKLDSSARSIELAKISFRPLDWNKARIAAVNELTDIIKAAGVEGISAVGVADDILAAGYRKCHNKTPSDKE